MPVCFVPETNYQQLIDNLETSVPRSLSIIWSLKNVLKGRLKANFYVDKWPDFSTVVCQYIWPRRSDVADIGAYATSSEALLSVLTEANLVTWGKRQEFQRIEDRHADYLLKNLRPPEMSPNEAGLQCIHERSHLHWYHREILTLQEAMDNFLTHLVSDGFVLGKLQPHHAEMVASHWPRLHGWPNKVPYFRELIKSYHCPAIYSTDNLDEPASYMVQFPCNQTFGYTKEEYRSSRLSSNLGFFVWILQSVAESGMFVGEGEFSDVSIFSSRPDFAGVILSDFTVKDLVTTSTIDSKL